MPLCRERRAVWKAKLGLHRRARRLTPLFELIGLALVKRLGPDGRLDPTHQTLADDVGCKVRSVRRAMVAFKACGLLSWDQRVERRGWRTEQTSNAYVLMTDGPLVVGMLPRGGQKVRQTFSIDKSMESCLLSQASNAEREAAKKALANRAAVIERRLLDGRSGGRLAAP